VSAGGQGTAYTAATFGEGWRERKRERERERERRIDQGHMKISVETAP
jgi:phage tail tape-measure protein